MTPFISQISPLGCTFTPAQWTFCAGQLLAISQYQTVYSLVGTYYGGDGRTTFGIPDLRGRMAIGSSQTGGQGPGLPYYQLGQRSGFWERTLSTLNLPAHSHNATFNPTGGGAPAEVHVSTANANTTTPGAGDLLAVVNDAGGRSVITQAAYVTAADAGTTVPLGGVSGGGGTTGTVAVDNTGSSSAFSIENPSLAVNYSFALDGIYPSRN